MGERAWLPLETPAPGCCLAASEALGATWLLAPSQQVGGVHGLGLAGVLPSTQGTALPAWLPPPAALPPTWSKPGPGPHPSSTARAQALGSQGSLCPLRTFLSVSPSVSYCQHPL